MIIRFAWSAMIFRTGLTPGREVFVRDQGWTPVEALKVGDLVSRGTIPASYQQVSAIEPESA